MSGFDAILLVIIALILGLFAGYFLGRKSVSQKIDGVAVINPIQNRFVLTISNTEAGSKDYLIFQVYQPLEEDAFNEN